MPKILKFCLSKGRPENVPDMEELLSPDFWVVHTAREADEYYDAGATDVHVSNTSNLGEKRQAVLEYMRTYHPDKWYASFDDDVFKIGYLGEEDYSFVPCGIDYIIEHISELMQLTGAYLGGCYHQDIVKFLNHRVHTRQLIPSCFMIINPDTPANWTTDPVLMFRDDQDFSIQHIQHHGLVLRANYMMVAARLYSGSGGLNESRSLMVEVESAKALMKKWPGEFKRRPGSDRPGDIVMTSTGAKGETHAAKLANHMLNP